MGMNFAGGILAARGFMDENERQGDRTRVEADRTRDQAYQDTQRAYQAEQQGRQRDQWGREDVERTEMAAIPETEPQDVQMRRMAAAKRKAGDTGAAIRLHQDADKIAIDRAEKKVQTILAGGANMTAMQLATAAAEALNDDPVPGGITNIADDGKGGVIIDVEDRVTGTTTKRAFADVAATREWLTAYKAPKVYAALQQLRHAAAIKAQEKAGEPVTLKPGERQFVRNAAGVMVEVAHNDPVGMLNIGTVENPQWIKPQNGPGGKGAKPADPDKAIDDHFEFVTTKGDAKLSPEQLGRGSRLAKQIFRESGGKLPKEVAVEAAIAVTLDPTKAAPSVDLRTGEIRTAYHHPELGEFVISKMAPEKVTPEQMRQAVQKLEAATDPKVLPEMKRAAHNPDDRIRFEAVVMGDLDGEYQRRIAGAPQQADALRAEQVQARRATSAALARKLELFKTYGQAPKEAGPERQPKTGTQPVGFTPPANSPVGIARARQRAEQERNAGQQTVTDQQRAESAKNAGIEAQRLISQDDGSEAGRRALAGFQETPGFALLDAKTKTEIHTRVNRAPAR